MCPGRPPIPGSDATARGDPQALGEGGPAARTFPNWGSRGGVGTGRGVGGRTRCHRAGLHCPSPGRQRPPERSRRCGVGELPPSRRKPGPPSPGARPPARPGPAAPAGPWGRRGGGEGRPRSPSSFVGPFSPLHLERKRAPRVMELSSFDLAHPRPGHPSSAFLFRGASSPLAPFGGEGILLSREIPGKRLRSPAVLRCPLEGTGRGRRAPGSG